MVALQKAQLEKCKDLLYPAHPQDSILGEGKETEETLWEEPLSGRQAAL